MTQERISRLREAARRGIDWIVAQQKSDGSLCQVEDGVGGYYKVPFALSLAGRLQEAQRLAAWIATHHFTEEGDFGTADRESRPSGHITWPIYTNAWLILGMHRLGQWDMALRGMEYILRYQLPSGGFYALDGDRQLLEPVCTSWGGLAALTTGNLEAARRAGDLLAAAISNQPDSQKFYFRMDVEGNLVTEVPAEAELLYFVDARRARQIYYNPGICLIFLSHLYRATGVQRYLDSCWELFNFLGRCSAEVCAFPPAGKVGMGCALLFELTGAPEVRHATLQVSEYQVQCQSAKGFWRLPDQEPFRSMVDRESFPCILDPTAEHSTFLLEIASRI